MYTYVRKRILVQYTKKRQDLLETDGSQDMLLLEIQVGTVSEPPTYVLNLYNTPVNCHHLGRAAELLIKSRSLMLNLVLIRGDLNLHHINWEARTFNATKQAKELSKWVSKNATFYKVPTGLITHDQRESINLVIASTFFTNSIVECYIEPKLDCTSNHQTICTTIEDCGHHRSQNPGGRFWLCQIKEEEFVLYLER